MTSAEVIPAFLLKYPAVDIALELSNLTVDLISSSIDLAIRMGPLADPSLLQHAWARCRAAGARRRLTHGNSIRRPPQKYGFST